jgi:hypothetical protein
VGGSNLPPGVGVHMIPGNRPEDEWHDVFDENLLIPDDLVLAIDPKVLSSFLNLTMAFLSATRNEAFQAGRQQEQQEQSTPLGAQCGALEPEIYVGCQRERGHHGDHHWQDTDLDREAWWPQ